MMTALEMLMLAANDETGNADAGCMMVMLEMVMLDVNDISGNAGACCKLQCYKC